MPLNYLRQSLFFFRQHLATILQIQLPFLLLINLATLWIEASSTAEAPASGNSLALLMLLNLTLLPLYWGATIFYFASVVADQPIGVGQALKLSLSRWRPLLLTYLGVALLTFGGLMLFIIPGIYLTIRLSFADYNCVLQKLSPQDAIRQSWSDTKAHFNTLIIGLGILFTTLMGSEFLLEMLLKNAGLLDPFSNMLINILFGLLACLYNIFGFRIYCIQQAKQL